MDEKKDEANVEAEEEKVTEFDNSEEDKKEDKKENKKEDKKEDKVEHFKHDNKTDLIDKARENPWMVASVVMGVLLLGFLFSGSSFTGSVITGSMVSGDIISANDAGEKMIDFAKKSVPDVELIEVNDDGTFYVVIISIEGNELPLYVTKDGKSFAQQLIPLVISDEPSTDTQGSQQQIQTDYTSDDLVKIKEFSQCLADNGVKAYGAGWCGYCEKLKESFGGVEQITPFYYECQNADRTPTEYAELCQQEEIRGFPTIKINGESYGGARTIEGLASAIEACDAPELSGATQQVQTQTAYTENDLVKISTFVDCLADKDVKIYGANWCAWTSKFVVETIGGFDVAAPIYVECTENEAECSAEGVSGYPTTKINGELYTGARDFAGLAQATGCQSPDVEELVQTASTTTGNC